jgi:hypothetical protein
MWFSDISRFSRSRHSVVCRLSIPCTHPSHISRSGVCPKHLARQEERSCECFQSREDISRLVTKGGMKRKFILSQERPEPGFFVPLGNLIGDLADVYALLCIGTQTAMCSIGGRG